MTTIPRASKAPCATRRGLGSADSDASARGSAKSLTKLFTLGTPGQARQFTRDIIGSVRARQVFSAADRLPPATPLEELMVLLRP